MATCTHRFVALLSCFTAQNSGASQISIVAVTGSAAAIANLQTARACPIWHAENFLYILTHTGVQTAAAPNSCSPPATALGLPTSSLLPEAAMMS